MPEGEAGSNMARQSSLRAGLPDAVPAMTINRFCSSGLQAIALAAERIRAGGADIVIAGGSESMSLTPRGGLKPAPNPWFVENWPEVFDNGPDCWRMHRKYGVSRRIPIVLVAQPSKCPACAVAGHFADESCPSR
jgi:acetyl-CoA acyltransferase